VGLGRRLLVPRWRLLELLGADENTHQRKEDDDA
jgi:hypothetical protein